MLHFPAPHMHGLHKHRWGQESLLSVLSRQFDLILLQGTWESVRRKSTGKINRRGEKQTMMLTFQWELLLLEFARHKCWNTTSVVTLLQDFLIWSRCKAPIMTIVPTKRKRHRTAFWGVQENSRKPMDLAGIHSTSPAVLGTSGGRCSGSDGWW